MDKWIEECGDELCRLLSIYLLTAADRTEVPAIIARHFAAWEADNEADLTVVWMTATAKERDRQRELITRLTDKVTKQRETIADRNDGIDALMADVKDAEERIAELEAEREAWGETAIQLQDRIAKLERIRRCVVLT